MIEFPLLITILILNAFAIWGFHISTEVEFLDEDRPELGINPHTKMIFWKLKVWCVKRIGWFWSKPICLCPPCMSSLHSTYFYFFFLFIVKFQIQWILFYPMYILILAGLNYFIGLLVSKASNR